MNIATQDSRSGSFLLGVLAGTVVGAGLAIWLAPRAASELRQRVNDSARELSNKASDRYQQVTTRVGEAVEVLTKKGQGVRDDMADAVLNGANEVARQAAAVKASSSARL